MDPQPQEKPEDSSYGFQADAQAVLEEAPDLDRGLGLLADYYNSKTWDNPIKAQDTFAQYAQELRYRFKDTPAYSVDDTLYHNPIELNKFTGQGETDDERKVDQINQWQDNNKALLKGASTAEQLIDRDKLIRSIDDTASYLRREAIGKQEGWLTDKAYRASKGLAGGILEAFGADKVVGYLTEHTNPQYDSGFWGPLAEGGGFTAGAIGATTAAESGNPAGAIVGGAYMLGNVIGPGRKAYAESLANTGDRTMATKAAILEGGSQALQLAVGPIITAGPAKGILSAVTKEGAPVASALGRTAVRTGEAALIGAGGAAVSNEAQQYESNNPDNTHVAEDIGKAAVLNAIFGAAGAGVHESVEGVRTFNRNTTPDVAFGESEATGRPHDADIQLSDIPSPEDFLQGRFGQALETPEPPPVYKQEAPIDNRTTQETQPAIPDPGESEQEAEVQSPAYSFKTQDGSTWTLRGDGDTAARTDANGTAHHPLDRTFYADEPTAINLARLKAIPNPDGTYPEPRIGNKGNLYFTNVQQDHPLAERGIIKPQGKKGEYRPQFSDEPAVGMYPIEVNNPRTANGVSPEVTFLPGSKITEFGAPTLDEQGEPVNPVAQAELKAQTIANEPGAAGGEASPSSATAGEKSAGAAQATNLKTTQVREKLLASPDIPMTAKNMIENHGWQFFIEPHEEVRTAASDFIRENGFIGATNRLLGRNQNESSPFLVELGRRLLDAHKEGIQRAEDAGDFEAASVIADRLVDVTNHLEDMGNISGRVLNFFKNLYADPKNYILGLRKKIRNGVKEKVALEEGIRPRDIDQMKYDLVGHQEKLKALADEGKAAQDAAVKAAEEKIKATQEKGVATPEQKLEIKRLKAKDPQEFLPADKAERFKEISRDARRAERILKKYDDRTSEKIQSSTKEAKELEQILKLMNTATGSFRDKLGKFAFEKEQKILDGVPLKMNSSQFWKAFWYGNQVSGLSTLIKKGIMFDAIHGSFLVPLSLAAAGKPGAGLYAMRGFIRAALGRGVDAAVDTLKTGKEYGSIWALDPDEAFSMTKANARKLYSAHDLLLHAPDEINLLGRKITDPRIIKALSTPGWALRGIGAIQSWYYTSLKAGTNDALAYLKASDLAKEGGDFRQAVGERLFDSTDRMRAAMKQAEGEAETAKKFGGESSDRETRLRAMEIMQEQQGEAWGKEINDFVQSVSLTKPVEGFLGKMIEPMAKLGNAEATIYGKAVKPFKFLMVFMRVAGNLTNLGLDYIPGTALAFGGEKAHTEVNEEGKTVNVPAVKNKLARYEGISRTALIGRQMTGLALTAGLTGIMYAFKDDKDPYLWLTGAGPSDPKQKEVFKNSGAIPYSIKVGDQYFSYHHSPLVLLLGGLGTIFDKLKYEPGYERGVFNNELTMFAAGAMNSMAHQSFLRPLGRLVDGITGENAHNVGASVEGLAEAGVGTVTDIAKGFIPFVGLGRTLSRMFEDPVSSYHDMKSAIVEGVPVAQELGNKWLNAFGDPLYSPLVQRVGSFFSQKTTDPDWRWLAENGYGVTIPLRVEIPGFKRSPDDNRIAQLGAKAAGVLTTDERIQLVKKAGPEIRAAVADMRQEYGNSAHDDNVQEALNKKVVNILHRNIRELFGD